MIHLSAFQDPTSPVFHRQENVKAVLDKRELGEGTLYITDDVVSWDGPHGFTVCYNNITLHALSRDVTVYPEECLYVMLEGPVILPDETMEPVQEEPQEILEAEDEDLNSSPTELLFIPKEKDCLSVMYDAVTRCQSLQSLSEMCDDDDDIFMDPEDEVTNDIVGEAGDANLLAMRNLQLSQENQNNGYHQEENVNDDQFEDAD